MTWWVLMGVGFYLLGCAATFLDFIAEAIGEAITPFMDAFLMAFMGMDPMLYGSPRPSRRQKFVPPIVWILVRTAQQETDSLCGQNPAAYAFILLTYFRLPWQLVNAVGGNFVYMRLLDNFFYTIMTDALGRVAQSVRARR